jgi:multimeric flavodoxin WrbA
MDYIHDRIIEADVIILAAPIFCMGICSQAKALVDRAQVFRSRKYVLQLPIVSPERKGKRLGIFLSTAGQNWDCLLERAETLKVLLKETLWSPKDRWFFFMYANGVKELRYMNQMFKLVGSKVFDKEEEEGLLSHLNDDEFLAMENSDLGEAPGAGQEGDGQSIEGDADDREKGRKSD